MRPYQVGEIILMEWYGWLKVFQVQSVTLVDEDHVEYGLTMVGNTGTGVGWIKPS
jgi:hypothetical protein